jgi:hypothetical protein
MSPDATVTRGWLDWALNLPWTVRSDDTIDLDHARAVHRVLGPARYGKPDPATRTFQALRIAVNDELGEVERLLAALPEVLNDDGRAAVISFHSLEDRLVKHAFRDAPALEVLTKKPIEPGVEECARNPRARFASARAMNDALSAWLGSDGARRSLRPPPRNPTPVRMTPMAFESAETLPGTDTLVDAKRRGRGWQVGLALAAVALLVGASWRVLGARNAAATPSPSAPVEAPHAVQLSIDALPRGAHVSVDDAPVMLPTTLRTDRMHRVRVDAPGYQPWGALVQPSQQDVALRFAGAALPDAPAPAVTPTAIPMLRRPDPPRTPARRAPRAGASPGQGGHIADPGF